jgi:hypothetical protein
VWREQQQQHKYKRENKINDNVEIFIIQNNMKNLIKFINIQYRRKKKRRTKEINLIKRCKQIAVGYFSIFNNSNIRKIKICYLQ